MRTSTVKPPRNQAWRSTEKLARIGIQQYVELFNIPPCGAKFIRGKGMVGTKVACDLIGTIKGKGRAFICDVKRSERVTAFYFADKLATHQRLEIVRAGHAGAVAGLIIECVPRSLWYWIDWAALETSETGIHWGELASIGSTNSPPQIGPLVI